LNHLPPTEFRSALYHENAGCKRDITTHVSRLQSRAQSSDPHKFAAARVRDLARFAGRVRLVAPGPAPDRRLLPSLDRSWIANQHQLTTEIREYRRVGGRFEFAGLPEVRKLIEKSRIGGAALETTEIRDVILVADRGAEWREIVRQPPAAMRSDWAAVQTLSAGIQDFTDFLRQFHNKILPDGTLDDRASAELSRIRREIEKQKRQIQESLRGYLRKLAKAAPCRMNSSPFAASALSYR